MLLSKRQKHLAKQHIASKPSTQMKKYNARVQDTMVKSQALSQFAESIQENLHDRLDEVTQSGDPGWASGVLEDGTGSVAAWCVSRRVSGFGLGHISEDEPIAQV